jgi:hypothetical protein
MVWRGAGLRQTFAINAFIVDGMNSVRAQPPVVGVTKTMIGKGVSCFGTAAHHVGHLHREDDIRVSVHGFHGLASIAASLMRNSGRPSTSRECDHEQGFVIDDQYFAAKVFIPNR